MSMSELRRKLSDIEPTESTYAGIGAAEVDLLKELMTDEEGWLAARAVHALRRIESDRAREAVVGAAGSNRLEVRVAAAAAAETLPSDASDEVLTRLLVDAEPAVRKFAVKSASERNSASVRRQLSEIAIADDDNALREIAARKARSVPPP